MQQIKVRDIIIEVAKKDIKNLHLGVYPPHGRVRIASPIKINDDAIRLFAVSKLSWIRKQQLKFKNQDRLPKREYISGESHYYEGRRYLLNVIYTKVLPKERVKLRNKTYLDLYVREGSSKAHREQVINSWYRAQMKAVLPALIAKWEKIIGVKVNVWGIKTMKTKWGTCNRAEKRIWLNLELIKKPKHCMEYIIVHEMTHFLERNHTEQYTAYLNKFMPQWKSYKNELNGYALEHKSWGK